MIRLTYLTLLLSVIGLFFSCGDDSPTDGESGFDRQELLENTANNLIRPAFERLTDEAEALHDLIEGLASNPLDAAMLTALKNQWRTTTEAFQSANGFNFLAAGESGTQKSVSEEIGTFPVRTTEVDARIASGDWNLSDFQRDARGLYALEYLLFAETEQNTIDRFAGEPETAVYLLDLAVDVRNRTRAVTAFWQTGIADFVENDGTSAGSSTSVLYNEFVKSFEAAKNFKLGLPLGKRAGQTQSEPQLVESAYAKSSLTLLELHLQSIWDTWNGTGINNLQGIGFREYLLAVEGGEALVQNTEMQWAAVQSALEQVDQTVPLREQIEAGGNPELDQFYTELQKMTRYFKSDLSSLLGISITFDSGDGD